MSSTSQNNLVGYNMQGAFLSEGDADFESLDSDNEYSDNSNDSEKEKEPKLNPATQKLQENETPTLPNHQETQSDQAKPFTCQFCKKTFKLNGRLKIHLKSIGYFYLHNIRTNAKTKYQ